jgi:hypothetical protein
LKCQEGVAVSDGQKPEKTFGPRGRPGKCQSCGGASVLAETIPKSLGSPTYEIYRCRECGGFDWVAQEEP